MDSLSNFNTTDSTATSNEKRELGCEFEFTFDMCHGDYCFC